MSGAESRSPADFILLCTTCHAGVDYHQVTTDLLAIIKDDWVQRAVPGKARLRNWLLAYGRTPWENLIETVGTAADGALDHVADLQRTLNLVEAQQSETAFLRTLLSPLIDALGFEGSRVLHQTGRTEHGKDIVFYERDRLGGFTWYAVVACLGDVHANSSRTLSPGHYAKIRDQLDKCFAAPFSDENLKGEFWIDKAVVACTGAITPDAMDYLREWESRNRRKIIFLPAQSIAGHLVRCRPAPRAT
jgi:hypothetical protein